MQRGGVFQNSVNYVKIQKKLLSRENVSEDNKAASITLIQLTWCLGLPTIAGKTALGASSPANPALHMPEPLSTTTA